jgi:hypothetical protein
MGLVFLGDANCLNFAPHPLTPFVVTAVFDNVKQRLASAHDILKKAFKASATSDAIEKWA